MTQLNQDLNSIEKLKIEQIPGGSKCRTLSKCSDYLTSNTVEPDWADLCNINDMIASLDEYEQAAEYEILDYMYTVFYCMICPERDLLDD